MPTVRIIIEQPLAGASAEALSEWEICGGSYDFRSGKFERRFGFVPTPYAQGIEAIVEADCR